MTPFVLWSCFFFRGRPGGQNAAEYFCSLVQATASWSKRGWEGVGWWVRGQKQVYVPKLSLRFRAPLTTSIFVQRKCFLMSVGGRRLGFARALTHAVRSCRPLPVGSCSITAPLPAAKRRARARPHTHPGVPRSPDGPRPPVCPPTCTRCPDLQRPARPTCPPARPPARSAATSQGFAPPSPLGPSRLPITTVPLLATPRPLCPYALQGRYPRPAVRLAPADGPRHCAHRRAAHRRGRDVRVVGAGAPVPADPVGGAAPPLRLEASRNGPAARGGLGTRRRGDARAARPKGAQCREHQLLLAVRPWAGDGAGGAPLPCTTNCTRHPAVV